MALFGVVALALHLATLVFANSIDGYLQYRPVRKDKDGEDRWARRQVGRLLGAYLCGIPVQALAKANGGLREVTVYGRREGAWNYRELQGVGRAFRTALHVMASSPQGSAWTRSGEPVAQRVFRGSSTYSRLCLRVSDSVLTIRLLPRHGAKADAGNDGTRSIANVWCR
eukprot:2849477-Rhodomonas_salina.3